MISRCSPWIVPATIGPALENLDQAYRCKRWSRRPPAGSGGARWRNRAAPGAGRNASGIHQRTPPARPRPSSRWNCKPEEFSCQPGARDRALRGLWRGGLSDVRGRRRPEAPSTATSMRALAARLWSRLRNCRLQLSGDRTAPRLAGEEFAILLERCDELSAWKLGTADHRTDAFIPSLRHDSWLQPGAAAGVSLIWADDTPQPVFSPAPARQYAGSMAAGGSSLRAPRRRSLCPHPGCRGGSRPCLLL